MDDRRKAAVTGVFSMLGGAGLLFWDGLCTLAGGDFRGYPSWYTVSLLAAKLLTGLFGFLLAGAGVGLIRRQKAIAAPAAGYWLLIICGALYALCIPLLLNAWLGDFVCEGRGEYGPACDLIGDYQPVFATLIAAALVGIAGALVLLWAVLWAGYHAEHRGAEAG